MSSTPASPRAQRLRRSLFVVGLLAAIAAPGVVMLGAVGSRCGWFSLHFGFDRLALRMAPALALGAVALGLASTVAALTIPPRRSLRLPLAVAGLGALVFAAIAGWRTQAYRAPPVHDVSTDWTHTVLFSPALMLARGQDADPVETNPVVPATPAAGAWGGQYVGVVNARTCPGAKPVVVAMTPDAAYARVKAALLARRRVLVTDDPTGGRLEATATGRWFGFKDDLAAIVRRQGGGARVDLRASARLGQSDFGRNCALVTALARTISR